MKIDCNSVSKSNHRKRLAILISGRGSNLRSLHRAVKCFWGGSIEIVCVASSKKHVLGVDFAQSNGLHCGVFDYSDYMNHNAFEQDMVNFIEPYKVDLVCLAGFMKLLRGPFLQRYKGNIVNIHPSLLPAFKGLNAQRQALDAGVKFTGCTVHDVNEGMDEGSIIAQGVVPVLINDTEDSLSDRILQAEHLCYPLAVEKLLLGKVTSIIPECLSDGSKFMLNI